MFVRECVCWSDCWTCVGGSLLVCEYICVCVCVYCFVGSCVRVCVVLVSV